MYLGENDFHESIRNYIGREVDFPLAPKGEDNSVAEEIFAVTVLNQPINLIEYADKIAGNDRTHVISFHDYQVDLVNLLDVD